MKKWLLWGLFVVFLSVPVLAQDFNSDIPACTSAQVSTLSQRVLDSGVVDDVIFASNRMTEGNINDLIAIVIDLDAAQQRWYADVAPSLPRCALAIEVRDATGQYVNEMLIGASMLQIALGLEMQGMSSSSQLALAAAEAHAERVELLGNEFTRLAGELGTASGTGSAASASTNALTVISPSPANVRSAPNATGEVVSTLQPGDTVTVLGTVTGDNVNGSDQWYEVEIDGRSRYVHTSLLGPEGSAWVPPPAPVVANPPVILPASSVQSTPPPPPPQVASSPFQCNGVDDLNCADFNSRGTNANGHLALCGDEDRLDADGDGHACEVW